MRKDDIPVIVRERLRVHRENEHPILDYYRAQGRLLEFTPFHGAKDLNMLKLIVEKWVSSFDG